jgi:hypothetical protein
VQFEDLMPGSVSAHQLDASPGTTECLRRQPEQGLIGGGINGWRGDSDAQLVPERLANLCHRSPWLQFYAEQNSVGLHSNVTRNCHQRVLLGLPG